MKLKIYIGLFLVFQGAAHTQEYSLLRQNDDLRMLDSNENQIPIQNTTLSFGGSWRFQAESFLNGEFDREAGQDNIWYLNRLLAHAHLKLGNKFELFGELGSSMAIDKNDLSPVDKDEVYLNQLIAKYKFSENWNLASGRQNIRLGSGRLVDVREGPNVRRTFDFVELNFQTNKFSAKFFFSVPVRPSFGSFDNSFLDFDETLSGLYTTTAISQAMHWDAYFLYQKENNAIYTDGEDNERRASIGFRHFGTFEKLKYNNEFVYQFGEFGDKNISAWTLSFNVERETDLFRESLVLGVKTEVIGGDRDPADNRLNTFDALYPRGAYFGKVARFGPSNLIDVHPYINVTFSKVQVGLDYAAFWRYSVHDGVYGPALTLDYPDLNNKRFIAHQLGGTLNFMPNKILYVELESNVIFPGPFLRESNLANVLYHFVLTFEIKL